MRTATIFLVALVASLLISSAALAGYTYTAWKYRMEKDKKVYYKHMDWDAKKSHHQIYYYPSRSKRYIYYRSYNPTKGAGRYWGRYDLETKEYQMLPEDKRKDDLDKIKEDDFGSRQKVSDIKVPDTKETLPEPPPLPEE
jgi:hypothetical protein